MRLNHLDVPEELNRNHPAIAALGANSTGAALLGMLAETLGRPTLENVHVLDIGCGVRFTSAIINRQIPIGRYVGVENDGRVFDYLVRNVLPFDDRFEFRFWNARNTLYSPGGVPAGDEPFPQINGPIDIVSMFSVITHQSPDDARVIFQHAREAAGGRGLMFFTAFVDPELRDFCDRSPDSPLMHAYYAPALLQSLLHEAGWQIDRIDPVSDLTQTRYTCRARHAQGL